MLWFIGFLILTAIVSGTARDLIKGLMTLLFGGMLLLAGCAIV